MDLISIGEFARRSRLSPKALRLYDELGLLPPARVDDSSGYRFYEVNQLKELRRCVACPATTAGSSATSLTFRCTSSGVRTTPPRRT